MKIIKKILFLIICCFLEAVFITLLINMSVKIKERNNIFTVNQIQHKNKFDCILVLGAGLRPDKTPSPILQDRLDTAIELYNQKTSDKILMSGDHRDNYYNEVQSMKDYVISKGIPEEAIMLDHSGFSTYESMYRAKYVFNFNNIIVVTQKYHLYRALFDAEGLGMAAIGVPAQDIEYNNQSMRDIREIAARNKDFLFTLFHVKIEI